MSLGPNDFVTINIKDTSRSYPSNYKIFCRFCSCNLVLLDAHKDEWFCNRCRISQFPGKGDKVRRANKFETPGDSGNGPIVAMVDDTAATYTTPRRSTFPKSLEILKRPGVTITDFNSTVDNESL